MKMLITKQVIILTILLTSAVFCTKWEKLGKFNGNEHFEYRVNSTDHRGEHSMIYILDIKPAGEDYEVSYTTKGKLTKSELGLETAFGLWGAYGISLNMVVLNPMYMAFFPQLELQVGEKMSFFGAGLMKVVGEETIAGIKGYKVEFYQTQNSEEKLVSEMTINPEIPLPLKSKIENSEAVLQAYRKN